MIGVLKQQKTAEEMPQLFEINHETGEIRSKIFYCDAQTWFLVKNFIGKIF